MKRQERFEEANFYLTGMGQSDSLLQSYRMIFGGLEAILFAFALAFLRTDRVNGINWIAIGIAIVGILCAVLWIGICRHRGTEVSVWRDKVINVVNGTDAGQFLKERWQGKHPIREMAFMHLSTRIILNYVLPALLILVWGYVLFVARN